VKKRIALLTGVALLLGSASAFGQTNPSFTVSNTTATVNEANHAVTVTFVNGNNPEPANTFGFQLNYDATRMSFASANSSLPGFACNDPPPLGEVLCLADAGGSSIPLNAIPNGTMTILFNIGGTPVPAPGVPLTLSNVEATGVTGQSLSPQTTNGSVIIVTGPQPTYSSTPAPTGACGGGVTPIVITDVVGGGATNSTFQVSNTGQAGSTLTISAASGLSAPLSLASPALPVNIAQGAAPQTFTVACNATTVGTGTPQTLALTHNATGSPAEYCFRCDGVAGPSAPTAALGAVSNPTGGPINTTGNGTVVVNVTDAGVPTASLTLNCSVPPGSANFQITGGGTRTINAPATVGPNDPPIGFSCVRQATAQTATLTCTQTANPGPNPDPLTATLTCPAGTTAPNPGVNPPSGTAINLVGPPNTTPSSTITFTNAGGTASWVVDSCTFNPAVAGYSVTGTFPLTVPAGGTQAIQVRCTTPGTPGTSLTSTTLTCTGNNAQFTATYPVTCRAEQAVPVPTMSAAGKAMMALLVILVGLIAVQLYRRSV